MSKYLKVNWANGPTLVPVKDTFIAAIDDVKQQIADITAVQIRNKSEVINATEATVQTVATNYIQTNYSREPQNYDGLILTITDKNNDKILYIYSTVSGIWINSGINDVDLSNYYTKDEVNTELAKKQNTIKDTDTLVVANLDTTYNGGRVTASTIKSVSGLNHIELDNDTFVNNLHVRKTITLGDPMVAGDVGKITELAEPTNPHDAANKGYVDSGLAGKLDKVTPDIADYFVYGTGPGIQSMYGIVTDAEGLIPRYTFNTRRLFVDDPMDKYDATNKKYVDNAIASAITTTLNTEV